MTEREEYELHQLEEKVRLYKETIQPWVQKKIDIYSLFMPTYIVYDDGKIDTDWRFPKEQQAVLDLLDEAIEIIRKNIFKNP